MEEGKLTAGHARTLIGHSDAPKLAQEIVSKGLSVRDAEALTRKPDASSRGGKSSAASARLQKDADTAALERSVSEHLGLAVEINHKGDKGGEVKISYKTLEQLDEVCRRLAGHKPQPMG